MGEPRTVRIRFVDRLAPGEVALLTFPDPAPHYAVLTEASPDNGPAPASTADSGVLDVRLEPGSRPAASAERNGDEAGARWIAAGMPSDSPPPITLSVRGADIIWRPGRAWLCAGADQSEAMLLAVIEFSFHERELRRLEQEVAGAWDDLERDKRLAWEAEPADLHSQKAVGLRMNQTLHRRIRHSRLSPWLLQPNRSLPLSAGKLGEELRVRAGVDDRLDAVDGHLEVFEHVYEMASQRLGEFRASHKEQVLEWVIIGLLAGEGLLLLLGMFWTPGG